MNKIKLCGFLFLIVAMASVVMSCECKHEIVVDVAVDATCTENGLTEGSHCNLCGEILTEQKTIPAKGHTETIIEEKTVTCTESGLTAGKACGECNVVLLEQTVIPAMGHITKSKNDALCLICNQDLGLWHVQYYVDVFNQPTNDGYVINKEYFEGTFSNSATTNSELYALLLIDKDDICIVLYEYARSQVKNSSSKNYEWYDVSIKTANGNVKEYECAIPPSSDRIVFKESDRNSVLDALKNGKEISIYIVERDRKTTNYLFTFSCSNFSEQYEFVK